MNRSVSLSQFDTSLFRHRIEEIEVYLLRILGSEMKILRKRLRSFCVMWNAVRLGEGGIGDAAANFASWEVPWAMSCTHQGKRKTRILAETHSVF